MAERLSDLVAADVTPKLLRTWNGSHATFLAARGEADATLTHIATAATDRLHNTAAVARTSYIHTAIVTAVKMGDGLPADRSARPRAYRNGEDGLLRLLQRES